MHLARKGLVVARRLWDYLNVLELVGNQLIRLFSKSVCLQLLSLSFSGSSPLLCRVRGHVVKSWISPFAFCLNANRLASLIRKSIHNLAQVLEVVLSFLRLIREVIESHAEIFSNREFLLEILDRLLIFRITVTRVSEHILWAFHKIFLFLPFVSLFFRVVEQLSRFAQFLLESGELVVSLGKLLLQLKDVIVFGNDAHFDHVLLHV